MRIQVVTLFPDEFRPLVALGVTGRGIREGRVSLELVNPRDFAADRHRTVDDRPYGGGPGMVMAVEPLRSAIRTARERAGRIGGTKGVDEIEAEIAAIESAYFKSATPSEGPDLESVVARWSDRAGARSAQAG